MRTELGDHYVDTLFQLYEGQVPHEADLVTYWFERTRAYMEAGKVHRAGLLATNSIRGGANREVLKRIKETGDIFMGWSDRAWVLDAASVRVSIIGFDLGLEHQRFLDGILVSSINPDLTSGGYDLTGAKRLKENIEISFMGDIKVGAFDITNEQAQEMLSKRGNPNGRPNSDVIRPWVNGLDITRRHRNMWIIDFGVNMSLEDAALYEAPFEYVKQHVYPTRKDNRMEKRAKLWWIHGDAAPRIREALATLSRFIISPRVAKYRLFVWAYPPTLPDGQLIVFARDDDYFFGVLHSRLHELWALRMGTWLGVGNDPRYTPTTTFETFPFPFPPGQEPPDDPRVQAIAAAARALVEKRERWLNPTSPPNPPLHSGEGGAMSAAELKKRTLTNLYNQRPQWLVNAHAALDAAVFAAYGWDATMGDDALLAALLALNGERANGKTSTA